MQFRHVNHIQPVVDHLVPSLQARLDNGQRVLWLIPGGSAKIIAIEVTKRLTGSRSNIAITLTDERYGRVGHADSNWQQLLDEGLELADAQVRPVLQGLEFDDTITAFSQEIERLLEWADYKIGLFGMGADGHIAGILPGAPVGEGAVAGYLAGEYRRITITPPIIARLDEAVLYAVGQSKHQALAELARELPVSEQPAQILKQVAKTTIYTDYRGD